ncbi:MAG: hypothetical protein KAG98_06780, partial [Lentisphaeria bacterium]|nr:hypothetical protein [Lentisphaeria bacterium]
EESSIYDALNRQTSTSKKLWGTVNGVEVPYESAIVLTSSFEYDLNDNLIKSIGNNGEITVFEYDDASRLEAKKVFKGSLLITKTVHIMDNNGNVLTVTNSTFAEDGSETVMSTVTSTYDSFNRLKTQTDANNNAAEMFYDSRGKVVKTVNAKNQVQLSEYNLLGQAVKSINEVGADVAATNGEVVTTREYDNLGKHIADVDDKGNRTEYEYDDLNRMVNKINPDDSFTSLAYNNDSQVVTTTDENGTVVTFTYDSQGGVDTKTITRVTGVEGVVGVVMTYDSQGRLLTAENYDENDQLVSKVGRKYNSLGELVEETQQIGTAPAKIVSYAINHATNEQTITYPSGKTVTYDRDQVNRLNSVVLGSVGGLPEDEVTVASYDYVGVRRSGMTLGNNVVQTYAYGDAGELVTIDNKLADSTILGLEYGYDELYNRLYEKRTTGTDSESDLFAYDSLNRLIKARYSETGIVPQFYDWTTDVAADKHDITLDTVHNRTGETLDGDLTSYISNDLNQYTAITGNINGTSSPTYDTVGNTTLYNGFDLAYDYQNRLVRVENSQQKINFLYDVSGRRVQKTLFEKGDGVTAPLADWVESTKTQYVYSGSEVIEEYDYSISTTNYALAKTYILGESVDQPIALILEPNATRQTPEVYYYHTNIQQSVMAMTDENGAVVERYSYDISGKQTVYDALGQTISIPQSSIGNQYGFTGRRIDVETGLMYFRARYYSPEQGRFISKDPLGFVDGMNSYAGYFAMFGMIDPSGMEARAAIASATWEGFKEGFTGSLKNQWDFAKEATGDTINYIKNNVDDSTWTQAAGVLNAVGGVVETFVGAGVTAGSGGLGSVIGIGIMAHGVDNVQAGIRQAWTGEEVDTGTSIGLQAAGLSRGTANLVDAGISIVATLGGGAYLRAARHSLVEVTSWVPIGITPDLNSGRWVVKGAATRFNFFRTALWGPTSSNLKNFKTMKNFKAITGFVPRSRLSFPKFHWKNEPLPLIKVFFGQWQLK